MPSISDALVIALQHHRAGRRNLAEEICRRILAAEPAHADALNLLGVIAHQAGRHSVAGELIGQAVSLRPAEAAYHSNLGEIRRAQGDLDAAVAYYRQAIERNPHLADVHFNLGIALQTQGKLNDAIACYRRAIELNPEFAEAHCALGNAARTQGRPSEAVACYQRAVQFMPGYAEAYSSLGRVLQDLTRIDEAVACYDMVVRLRPDLPESHYDLGVALDRQGNTGAAISAYRRALELKPDYADACNNLGNAHLVQNECDEAIGCYRRALLWAPFDGDIHYNLGNALKARGSLDQAVACYRRALELKPGLIDAHTNLGNALKDQGMLVEGVACYRRAVELAPDRSPLWSNMLYALQFCSEYSPTAVFDEHRRWSRQCAESLASRIEPYANDRCADRRLRIGYVSPDFRRHVVGFNLLPLVRHHDSRQYAVYCYADVVQPDDFTDRFRSSAEVWRCTTGMADDDLARQIRDDRIDILVDLTLHMNGNRLLLFARKPAPVQVTFGGYPGTTGLTAVDYRVTDPYLDPPGHNDSNYTEQSVRLEHSFWCYEPLSADPAVSPLPALSQGFVTFGCLCNFCKVSPALLRLWGQMLQAVDRSRLVVRAPEGAARQRVVDALEGVAPDRLAFVPTQPHGEYLETYSRIDIGLDTFPYNGHTTTLDSLWMGVPVVSLAGETAVGRGGLSILSNAGLSSYVTCDPDQYVAIGVDLAHDLPRLANLRATLRQRMQNSPLMDTPRFARSIESAYRTMWQRWCAT